MSASTFVRARIDVEIKEEAAIVLEAMGLTVSDAVRMLLTRVAREKALPVELMTPNPATIASLKEARAGGLRKFGSVSDLMADLNDEDD
ncbi:DNA-damage-inducible protein J [Cupriavidus necator]|uniref:DNA-damage-inducible protein J n=1 Tax=Cupriavidus necator (strain ATCC 17699 / DSM 428 / KCTC 22496 / NCIMB 10442 / H16 / Stanier 337) TaxID=381666 RepID=Q0JYB7_CUPNH|nr:MULTISPECIES: type II toxin-antitoxin system RelB/DinJ family antitoxin [Cupriavidus]EON20060.1 DNA-damage-inducible protein J [Cupriavidus sp. GA3-3]KUE88497.1 XRE family transcriptional regulator [Cupriavidus necator]QCC05022.1 type II toxin-antitoxin system RelB/DinJ family antitoxin [Cupriavidus necator H16]QQB79710.1 type II toxin-antitoxin system RelB/DinJ family antitoxin [Cupriavidus necator]WKA43955.1 type II toxin-antitoxin system RelB/DinJ family antitoxin [Cupriavidus necator]